jgi:hypothetical protein
VQIPAWKVDGGLGAALPPESLRLSAREAAKPQLRQAIVLSYFGALLFDHSYFDLSYFDLNYFDLSSRLAAERIRASGLSDALRKWGAASSGSFRAHRI